ncbi:BTB/POZ domain-containing protein POB1 isoform X4 [Sesamum indicum]|uniref:BTB/POZ domain-containing protein POB1 isoform X3 n=1 Tax=Sesamum indicum TaxID=4182 RepID=A0A6I9U045_SESIN|nr:BTB/POZ domain-containing protein POB1 isoform X3 [Sesamum indicum]XP_011093272.1 BTB/POZ domain-containing protein POB1 isoform X4 [Sesamum indicum]
MRDWGLDLFDPRTAVLDSDSSSSPTGGGDPDFGFAFNDSNFSDRVLRIEIVADPPEAPPESEGCRTLADWAARKSKRRRGDVVKKENALDINNCPEEQILDCQQPDVEDGAGDENHDEEDIPMIEDSPSGDEAANSDDSNWSEDGSRVLRVRTLHISSPILAAKSPFFYKLFSNGMMESEQRHVTLRISASEEAAVMELLNFMYSGTLNASTAPALLDVLMAADKFEVASCMRHCSRLLRNLAMTPESALLYLDLPSSVLMADAVQPLTDAAKQFLAARYKDISKYQDEVMNLPLAGIEAILSSNDLQVASEDAVYDFVLKWTRTHYQKLEERRDILSSRLGRYIRFPYMTCRKLRKVLTCSDFDHDFATKSVLDALFFKAEAPHRQRSHATEESTSTSRRFVERAYKYRPVKVVEFELPRQQCVVYLDLKREECANLFPSGRVYSQAFHLGGQGFFLSAHCNMDQQSSFHCFGLFLGMQEKGSVSFAVDYEFAARSKPTEEYISKYKGNYTFTGGKAVGYRNLFSIPWTSFMAEDSLYFINGILHLRAELTIKR